MRSRAPFLSVCLVLAFAAAGLAGNWPRFRGPNGTGIVPDKDIPVEWTDKNVLWKVELPGQGNSSPIIWGDNIFLQSASKDGAERYLLCLNTKDGAIRWKTMVPGDMAKTHLRNTLASATPATDGERVYAAFWDGKNCWLHGFDFNGKELWKRDLGTYESQHGAGHSPVVYDGRVFFPYDMDGAATLLALDGKTGKNLWQVPRTPFRASYSAPFMLEHDGQPELIVASTAGVSGYNPDNGGENWHWTWSFTGMPLRTVASPIAGQGMIFANSGDGGGARHSIALKADGKGDVTKTNLVWENKKILPYVPGMLLYGDNLYFVNDRGLAGCFVARSGEEVWTERLGGGFTASPVLINGNVYAPSEEGHVFVFAAAPTFKLLAKNNLGEGVMASPAVADNKLYIRGKTSLFCIGKP